MKPVSELRVKIFADGADLQGMREMARQPWIKGFTTNPTLMRKAGVIRDLAGAGIKVNVTAILTLDQVRDAAQALAGGAPAYVSVFAGRVADTGRDPVPLMAAAREIAALTPNVELIWASPREVLN